MNERIVTAWKYIIIGSTLMFIGIYGQSLLF